MFACLRQTKLEFNVYMQIHTASVLVTTLTLSISMIKCGQPAMKLAFQLTEKTLKGSVVVTPGHNEFKTVFKAISLDNCSTGNELYDLVSNFKKIKLQGCKY